MITTKMKTIIMDVMRAPGQAAGENPGAAQACAAGEPRAAGANDSMQDKTAVAPEAEDIGGDVDMPVQRVLPPRMR
jgi:hypothetical protein